MGFGGNFEPSAVGAGQGFDYTLTSDGTTVVGYGELGQVVARGSDGGAVLTTILGLLPAAGGAIAFRNDGNVFPWGSVPALPKSITGRLLIVGNGAAVKLSAGGPRFLDFHRTADYDTFQNIEVGGFVVDCNSVDVAQHTIIGNRDGVGGTPNDQRVNVNNIYVHDIRVMNVPYTSGNRSAISIGCHHLGSGETQTNLTDLRFERIRVEGGPTAITITGAVSPFNSATAVNVYYDNIIIDGLYHTSGGSRASGSGSTVQIGQNGFGDRVTIRDVESIYSPDVVVELDACQTGWVENVRGFNPSGGGILTTNFRAPPNTDTQRVEYVGCQIRQDDPANTAGLAFNVKTNNAIGIGAVTLRDCTVYKNLAEVKTNVGILLECTATVLAKISIDNCLAAHDGLSTTAGGTLYGVHIQATAGPVAACDVDVRNTTIRVNGAYTSGTKPQIECFTVMNSGANVVLNVDGFDIDVNVSGYAADTKMIGFALNRTGPSTVGGVIRRMRIISLGSDTVARGVAVGTTTNWTISPAPLIVEECDFTNLLAAPREFIVDATQTALGAVLARNNRWKTKPVPVALTGLVTATGKILGAAGATVFWPMLVQCLQGSGSAITAIDFSTNDGITYTNLVTQASAALPAGPGPETGPLLPADLLRVTFTGTQPTITLVPVNP